MHQLFKFRSQKARMGFLSAGPNDCEGPAYSICNSKIVRDAPNFTLACIPRTQSFLIFSYFLIKQKVNENI